MSSEVERLKEVYRGYHESAAVRARWSQSNRGNRAIAVERLAAIRKMLTALGSMPLSGQTILDVGCGSGSNLASLQKFGADSPALYGVDLLSDRVTHAGQAYPAIAFQVANAEALPFASEYFDLVLLYTVFSSILDQNMAVNVASEVWRVLKPGGAVLWYDFRYNNPFNLHVRGIGRATLRSLFPGSKMRLQPITLLPPLARKLGPATPLLYSLLAQVPPLKTHYLGWLVKHCPGETSEH